MTKTLFIALMGYCAGVLLVKLVAWGFKLKHRRYSGGEQISNIE